MNLLRSRDGTNLLESCYGMSLLGTVLWYEFTVTYTSLLDLDKLLTRIVEASVDITGAEEGYLLLLDEGTGELYLRAGQNLGEEHAQGFRLKVHDSIAGSVVKTGKPVIVESKKGRSLKIKTGYHAQALLNVPLKVREKVIGVLGVNNKVSDKAFSEDNLYMLSILADYAAIAIENAQLFDDAKQRARNLETLQNLTLTVSSSLDLNETLRKACQAAVEFFNADHSGLVLFDPSYVEGKVRAEYPALGTLGATIPLRGVPAEERLIETKEPLTISDVVGDESLGPVRDILGKFDICSILVVPVVFKGRMLGSFSLDATGRLRTFTENEVDLCKIFAAQVAVAIEHARLYRSMEGQAERLTVLYEIGREMTSALEPERILDSIAEHIVRLIGAKRSLFLLVDKEKGCLIKAVGHGYPPEHLQRLTFEEVEAGVSGWVLRTGKPVSVADAQSDPRNTGIALEKAKQFDTVPLIVAPLVIKGEVIGTLTAVNTRDDPPFTEDDLNMVVMLADQAAIATEKARLFSQLSETKERLNGLIAFSLDAVIAIDQDQKITVFNRRAEEMFGWTAKEMEGRSVAQLHVDFGRAQEIHEMVNREGAIAGWEIVLKHKDGTRIPALLSAALIRDNQGNPIGQAGFMRDLRRVNLLEERLRALIQASQAITSVLELDQVLDRIMQAALVAFPTAQNGAIHLYDERTDTLYLRANTFGYSASAIEALCLRPGEGISGWVFQHRESVVMNNPEQDPRYKWIDHPEVSVHKSIICVPLQVRDRVIGTLSLDNLNVVDAFRGDDLGLLSTFADQVAIAIDNAHLYQETRRREQLLVALDEASRHIRAERETSKLLHEVVRLAAQLVGCAAGALFINHPQLGELELRVAYGLPPELVGSRLPHANGLAGLVARTGKPQIIAGYSDWPDREAIFEPYNLRTVAGVPLEHAGIVDAVLLVADNTGSQRLLQADLEILMRFATQATIALQASRLLGREQRMFGQLSILHQISDYIQVAKDLDKILHAVLTSVTAGYGLGFNRAALLLLDERRECLVGRMGIGYLEESEAKQDWAQHHDRGLENFRSYLELLDRNGLPLTPVGEGIRAVQLPVTLANGDLFWKTMREQRCTLVTPDELQKLPEGFVKAFEPALPLAIAPLIARGQTIGLLIVGNKFTQSPITSEDNEALMTFANTAAVAIDNAQLYHDNEVGRGRLRSFYEASNALVSSKDPSQVLRDIVERVRVAADAAWVSVILIDETGRARDLITAGTDKKFDVASVIRPDGLSMQVMRTGQVEIIEDTNRQRERVNPSMFRDNIAAALCLPLSLQGKRIGVVWLHYDSPLYFPDFEIEALQLYVNQAAIVYDSAQRIKEEEHLRQAAEALAGAAGLQEILEQIVQSAREVLQAESAAIWSYDDVRDSFIPESSVSSGIPPDLWQEFRQEEPRLGRTAYTVMSQGWVGVSDVADTERYGFLGESTRKLLGQIGVQSFQGITLMVGDEKLGVLYVNYNSPCSFHDKEREIARTFANHAALALKKARLLEQVRKARDAARVVAEVTVLEDLKGTLNSIVQGTQDALVSDAVTLYTYDQDREKLGYPPVMIGVRQPEKAKRFPEVPKHSVVFEILKRDEPYVVEEATTDSLFKGLRFVIEEEVKSCVGIPLKVGDRKVGVMFVNYRAYHRFTSDELTNLELFANQAAVAIRNAQLYNETNERAATLETIYEAGKVVTSSLTLKEILSRIAKQALNLATPRGQPTHFSHLALVEGKQVRFVAASSPEILAELHEKVGEIDLEKSLRIGITGRVTQTGISQNIGDVNQDPDYIALRPCTRSQLAVPIKIGDRVIGVINVEHPEHDTFDKEDQQALEHLAAQAAISIKNARLYEKQQQKTEQLGLINHIAAQISSSLDLEKILQTLVNELARVIGVEQCALAVFDKRGEYADVVGEYLEEGCVPSKAVSQRIPVRGNSAIELVRNTRKPLAVKDAQRDPRMEKVWEIMKQRRTQSIMIVPVSIGDEIIGTIGLDAVSGPREFTQDEQSLADTIAHYAAIAIQNARQYEELKRTKGLVGARTALAWMGMVSAAWRHGIGNYATTIEDLMKHLHSDLDAGAPIGKLKQRLADIEGMVKKIRETPITAPLSIEEGVESVLINDLIRERVKQLWDRDPYKSMQCRFDLTLDECATVKASSEWLKRALDILIDNAAEAMAESAAKVLTVATRLVDNSVEIIVSDTAKGIPEDVMLKLFQEPIKKPKGAKGMGVGLLQAQTIVQTYGGDIYVDSTGLVGTTMVVCLPLEA